MKIIVCAKDEKEKAYLEATLTEHELVFADDLLHFDATTPDEEVVCLSVFIKTKVGAREMDLFPRLRGIVTRSTGFDHIDVAEATRRGITVSNVPAYGENTIAEYAFAMLLSLSRRIYESYTRIRNEGVYTTEGLEGFDLKGKKMGVVGTGHTGQHAIRIARGFGMDVIAYDVHEQKNLEGALGFMYVTFNDLLAQSDVITLHAPYNSHTHHLINTGNMHLIKQGAYLINTARGGLVETRALISMIENKTLAGAGLDVVEEELHMTERTSVLTDENPDPAVLQVLLSNQYLIDSPHVLIMPHNAFNTHEALERILATTAENIEAIAQGTPKNVIAPRT